MLNLPCNFCFVCFEGSLYDVEFERVSQFFSPPKCSGLKHCFRSLVQDVLEVYCVFVGFLSFSDVSRTTVVSISVLVNVAF